MDASVNRSVCALVFLVAGMAACANVLGIKDFPLEDADAGQGGAATVEGGAGDAAPTMDSANDSTVTNLDGSREAMADASDGTVPVDGANVGPDAATEAGPDGAPCTNACSAGLTECASGGVQSCQVQANGCTQWVPTATCGTHQTCTVAGGDGGAVASCACSATACSQAGTLCQDAQTLATCAKDSDGCFYVTTSPCTSPQTCSGMPPTASCSVTCSDSCAAGQTSCVTGGLATCTLGSNGCRAYGAPVACGMRQTCTGSAGSAACTCNTDPVCTSAASACASTTMLATCAKDGQGCVYQSATMVCPNGACATGACSNVCEFDISTFDNGCVFAP